MAVLPVGIGPVTGYQISRSLRFNSADSAYLNRTFASAGNRTTWTYSVWLKRSSFAAFNRFLSDSSNNSYLRFNTSDALDWNFWNGTTSYTITTSQVFRDPSAWYHIIVAVDTTQATSSNRVKFYVNGSQITAFSSASYPAQNATSNFNNNTAHYISSYSGSAEFFAGYITEVHFIDGQALTPSSFGETDAQTGVWKPKKYTGTYGTNGFYLNFSDNSGTTATTLGKDSSGNGNNWTPNNFSVTAGAGNDSLVDTPTPYGSDTGAGGEVRGNYATLNPLDNQGVTLANGNLDVSYGSASWKTTRSTISMPSGKWYFEFLLNNTWIYGEVGVQLTSAPLPSSGWIGDTGMNGYAYQTDGTLRQNGTSTSSGITSGSANDVVMCAIDIDAGKFWFGKNGTWFNSGNPATNTSPSFTGLSGAYSPAVSMYSASGTNSMSLNFGQRPFAYTAPSGYKALCTQNLPTPTIGATSTTQADNYFDIDVYTGIAGTYTKTGLGFQPDLIWGKGRNAATGHRLVDAVRGGTLKLATNLTDAESTDVAAYTFTSDGYSIPGGVNHNNNTGTTYVAWLWKANGAGSSNTQGSITSTVSANTTAGFSIVTYTGTGANATVGHGLGVAPSMVICKSRGTAGTNWGVWHTSIANTEYLLLNSTAAKATAATAWNSTSPTSTLVSLGSSSISNDASTMVMYAFAAVAGYSAFGSYTGNGSTDGPFVYLGFRPRYVMLKASSSAGYSWQIQDTARDTYNQTQYTLRADSSAAELTTVENLDILSNGFKLRSTNANCNSSGVTYIWAAFAESPFKYSLAR